MDGKTPPPVAKESQPGFSGLFCCLYGKRTGLNKVRPASYFHDLLAQSAKDSSLCSAGPKLLPASSLSSYFAASTAESDTLLLTVLEQPGF
ncbi:hypothetical protein [uncultured Cloacibacillus sp.]|uniref:hypothetical protein n=1 Tax=uncultured Cloacibacillus sp. TaxID=889794 RepID=UPI0026282326|nr:hypothetical protein [uncultured Cloacibacillus sp.]